MTERFDAALELATYHRDLLADLNTQYILGGDQIADALAEFDLELPQIQYAQSWAADHAQEHNAAADIVEDIADVGSDLLLLRLSLDVCLAWFTAALAAAHRLNRIREMCVHHGNLGIVQRRRNDHPSAAEHLGTALDIAVELGERELQGLWAGNLGGVYLDTEQFDEAEAYYNRALKIATELQDLRRQGIWLSNLATVYQRQSKLEQALAAYQQALVYQRQIGDKRAEGNTLDSMGNVSSRLGRANEAILQ